MLSLHVSWLVDEHVCINRDGVGCGPARPHSTSKMLARFEVRCDFSPPAKIILRIQMSLGESWAFFFYVLIATPLPVRGGLPLSLLLVRHLLSPFPPCAIVCCALLQVRLLFINAATACIRALRCFSDTQLRRLSELGPAQTPWAVRIFPLFIYFTDCRA